MIHIVEGCIGSGKTYFLVQWLLEHFFRWSKFIMEWVPLESAPKKIYTNIKGFKLFDEQFDLMSRIEEVGGVSEFFQVLEPQTPNERLKYPELLNSIILIDEAQGPAFFYKKWSDKNVLYFLQYHRHFGIKEIFLTCQDVYNMSPDVRNLAEYHIKAARQSLQIGGFRYQKFYADEPGPRSFIKRDQRVFDVYHSVEKGTVVHHEPSVLYRYAIFICLGVLGVCFGAYVMTHWIFKGVRPAQANVRTVKTQSVNPLLSNYSAPFVAASPERPKDSNVVPVVPSSVSEKINYRSVDYVRSHCEDAGYFRDLANKHNYSVYDCSDRSVTFEGDHFLRSYRKHEQSSAVVSVSSTRVVPSAVVPVSLPSNLGAPVADKPSKTVNPVQSPGISPGPFVQGNQNVNWAPPH